MAIPLKDKDKRVVAQIMHHLTLANNQFRAGTSHSMVFRQILDSVSGFIEILAADYKTLVFKEENNNLNVNGAVFEAINEEDIWMKNFITLMKHNHFESIEFNDGINSGELFVFLESMSARKGINGTNSCLEKFPDCHIKITSGLKVDKVEIPKTLL